MLPVPTLDERSYEAILEEALARIPVHTPEWTNFNKSDPGVTLLELFAFMTENLLYRANLIPERNRRKFLSLLGVGVQPGATAQGLATIYNDRGLRRTETLAPNLELRAGSVPFRSQRTLDVLPIEARVFYKRPVEVNAADRESFRDLFASFFPSTQGVNLSPYETTALEAQGAAVDLGTDTVDGSLWLALLLRQDDRPSPDSDNGWVKMRQELSRALAGKVLSLGIVPDLSEAQRHLPPGGALEGPKLLSFSLPQVSRAPITPAGVQASYRPLNDVHFLADVMTEPGVVEITLPEAAALDLSAAWRSLEPLEGGVGDLPPTLPDSADELRILTWLRVSSSKALRARIGWVGINAVMVRQESWVRNERLAEGTGEPDQQAVLNKTPVLPETLTLRVAAANEAARIWQRVDDLLSAEPEVPVADLRQAPGHRSPKAARYSSEVYALDPASGQLSFGDGFHGKRPPLAAVLRADYAYGLGAAGNVEAGQINSSSSLPPGFSVSNPVRTWGGAPAQTVAEAEKTIPRVLQARDRLVNAADFVSLVHQTPGVAVGRVEVLPAYNPALSESAPGDAPGAVTLLLIPQSDPVQPDAPLPDALFMEAVCRHLEPRRLITTELLLRPPVYRSVWVSVGLEVVSGVAYAQVREAVKLALRRFLSPLPEQQESPEQLTERPQAPLYRRGWPLGKPLLELELLSEVSRVEGVRLVKSLLMGLDNQGPLAQVSFSHLELPRLVGLSVAQGDALSLAALRGQEVGESRAFLPVPYVAAECK